MTPTVAVLGTGGTIASTGGDGGATPSKRGADLVDAVPELAAYADLTVEEVVQIPSFDMDFETLSTLASAARSAADEGVDGIVVTHGTDTMEESAYYLDLTLETGVPVVFTGAQRRPDEVSPDGPANLLAAVRAASHDRIEGGVYVAANEELHAARDVTKTHTSKLETFESPDAGPIATLTRTGMRFVREPRSYAVPFDDDVDPLSTDVAIVPSAAGVGRRAVDRVLEDDVDGIVVDGTGLGNATTGIAEGIADAVDGGTPVVVSSRCLAGRTAPVYGGGGGGETLRSLGAIHAGDLPAQKARIRLALACEAATDREEATALFAAGIADGEPGD